ncbi:MAG: HAD family hydrolase [Symploca sp. SIO3E6]|nr:HAD family hydrolase [Caldora sp. SIO3E6]
MNCVATSNLQPTQDHRHQNHALGCQLTVFCDFDGPIVDVSRRYYTTYQLALAATQAFYQAQGITLPINSLSKQQFWEMKRSRIPDVDIASNSGLHQEQIDFFLSRVVEIVNHPTVLHQDKLQLGVNWALSLLHSRCVRLVLVTLRSQSQATQILRNHGLTRLFGGIYGTSDRHAAYRNYTNLKKQLLQQAMAEQLPSSEPTGSAWMVGDTEADIVAAQALSLPTIALTCGIRSFSYLQQFEPTYIYTDLLTAAQHLLGFRSNQSLTTLGIGNRE